MTRLLLAVALFFPHLAGQAGASPQLEFTAQLNADGSRLKFDWVNKGERPFLIKVGTLVGGVLDPRVQISISGAGIPLGHLIDTSLPPAVGGNVDSLVVCLAARTGYSEELLTDKLWLPGFKKTLKEVFGQSWTAVVSYTGVRAYRETPDHGRIPFDSIPEYLGVPFWTGVIKTDVVKAPKG